MLKSELINRKFIEVNDVSDWDILTDTGFQPIQSSNKTIEYRKFHIVTESGKELYCADDHILFTSEHEEIFAKDCLGYHIHTKDGMELVLSVTDTGIDENMYDLSVDSDDHRYYTNDILSHNSTTLAGYIAWYTLFNDTKNSMILANKLNTAKEIFSRVQFIIEACPKWLQQGVKEWNKTSLILENGSKVSCAATSASAVRGNSISLLALDEFAFLSPTLAEEFIASVFPTISSAKTSKMIIVSTPKGMNHFYKMWTEAEQGLNGFKTVETHWSQHPDRDQAWADEQLQLLGTVKFNQEISCQFLGSERTLIDGKKISELPMLKGNQLFPDYIEYFPPDKSKSYVITVDTSRGSELDYSAFPIIDISTMPYKVVAVYRNNAISSLVYPEVIYRAGKRYNDAFVLIESNDLGQQVADILFYDLEYENVYMSVKDKVKEGGGSKKSPGLRTTKRTKAIGCSQLKDLIENDQLEVNDPEIISELSTFIRKGASYAADEGKHDDLAMCLVMFGYLVQEPIFKDLFDFSLRDMMIKNQLKELDDILDPIGFFDRGDDFVMSSDRHSQNGWTENTTDDWNF